MLVKKFVDCLYHGMLDDDNADSELKTTDVLKIPLHDMKNMAA